VTWWTRPFVTYGLNPMIAFVGSGMMGKAITSLVRLEIDGTTMSLKAAVFRGAFEPWFSPRNASLAYAICFVLLWYAILWLLERQRIILKV
jgi:predicted acyltransferase